MISNNSSAFNDLGNWYAENNFTLTSVPVNMSAPNTLEVSVVVFGFIITISALSMCINLTVLLVSFQCLVSNFHRLCVLMLLFTDCIMGMHGIWIGASKITNLGISDRVCRFEIFISTVGILCQYVLIFLICFQRYLAVKYFNFGCVKSLEKRKLVIIVGSLSIAFVFLFCVVFFIPNDPASTECNIESFYGPNLSMFFYLIYFPSTLFILLIIILLALTGHKIWKTFFSSKIHPLDRQLPKAFDSKGLKQKSNKFTLDKRSLKYALNINKEIKQRKFSTFEGCRNGNQCPTQNDLQIEDVNQQIESSVIDNMEKVKTNNKSDAQGQGEQRVRKPTPFVSNLTLLNQSTITLSDKETVSPTFSIEILESKLEVTNQESPASHSTIRRSDSKLSITVMKAIHKFRTPSKKLSTSKQRWHIRAFLTCVVIGITTSLLTGPLVIIGWLQMYLQVKTGIFRALFFALHSINFVVDPFIYAWRIKEIQDQFKRICRRQPGLRQREEEV